MANNIKTISPSPCHGDPFCCFNFCPYFFSLQPSSLDQTWTTGKAIPLKSCTAREDKRTVRYVSAALGQVHPEFLPTCILLLGNGDHTLLIALMHHYCFTTETQYRLRMDFSAFVSHITGWLLFLPYQVQSQFTRLSVSWLHQDLISPGWMCPVTAMLDDSNPQEQGKKLKTGHEEKRAFNVQHEITAAQKWKSAPPVVTLCGRAEV